MPRARFEDGRPGRIRPLTRGGYHDNSQSRAAAYGQIEEPEGPARARVSMSLADAKRIADEKQAFKDQVRKVWPKEGAR